MRAELHRKTLQIAELRREIEQRVADRTVEVRLSDERLALALDSAGAASWDWDALDDRLDWTPRFLELFGLTASDPPTMQTVIACVHPDDQGRLRARIQQMLTTPGDDVWGEEFRVQHPRHGLRHVAGLGRAFRDASGRVVRLTGIDLDVTERVLTEEALREADRRKDAFLATLSHELRNPLAPLVSGLELLCEPTITESRRDEIHGVMRRQLAQMSRLLEDLLDVARITCDKIVLQRAPVRLDDVVARAVETCRHLLDARHIELKRVDAGGPLELDGDLTRLVQVLANLLDNAAKYSEVGGKVVVGTRRDGPNAIVSVLDAGIGIAPDVLPHVFDLFTQGAVTDDRKGGGLGIGLALVRRLVEMHGGSVRATSAGLGCGSRFVIRLPLLVERSLQQPAKERPGSSPRRRILIADDNIDAVSMLALLLEARGHEVRSAGDGIEAVEIGERFRPDVVILDIGMPRLDGYGAARRIRELAWGRGVLLIAQTGWGQPEDRRRADEAGFDVHLLKPVAIEQLERVLAATFEEPVDRHQN